MVGDTATHVDHDDVLGLSLSAAAFGRLGRLGAEEVRQAQAGYGEPANADDVAPGETVALAVGVSTNTEHSDSDPNPSCS